MKLRNYILATLILLAPSSLLAETVEGKLDAVSLNRETVSVNGVIYDVNTEMTRVLYRGERMGEEDLRPGDDVILVFDDGTAPREKRRLLTIILVSGSKGGLES